MPRPVLTLDLSPDVYDRLQQRAHQHQRRLEEEASLALAAALNLPAALPDDFEMVLTSLDTLDSDTLLQVSHSQPTAEDGILLHALEDKRRRMGLTPAEEQWLADLGERHIALWCYVQRPWRCSTSAASM
jgi:hypothetical protein